MLPPLPPNMPKMSSWGGSKRGTAGKGAANGCTLSPWLSNRLIRSDRIWSVQPVSYLTPCSPKSVGDKASFTPPSTAWNQDYSCFRHFSPVIHLSSWCVSASWNVGVPRAAAWGFRKHSRTFADQFGSALCSFACLADHHEPQIKPCNINTCQVTTPRFK